MPPSVIALRRLFVLGAALGLGAAVLLAAAASPGSIPAPLTRLAPAAQASRETRLDVTAHARHDPLSELPFLAAALTSPRGTAQRLALLEHARRRNPLNLDVRSALLEAYMYSGTTDQAVSEIVTLLRLVPATRERLYPVLTALILDPDSSEQAIAALGDTPVRSELMVALARANASPFLLIAMSADLKGAGAGPQARSWLSGVAEPYAQIGDLEAAWLLWSHFNAVPPSPRPLLNDPGLALMLPPPFGWALIQQAASGYTETSGGVLRITDQGQGRWTAAQQLLQLPAGNYQLQSDVLSGGDQPELAWQIECVAAQGSTAALLLDWTLTGERAAAAGPFTVPAAGCPGQWLRLVVRPPALPDTRSVMIGKLALVRRGTV